MRNLVHQSLRWETASLRCVSQTAQVVTLYVGLTVLFVKPSCRREQAIKQEKLNIPKSSVVLHARCSTASAFYNYESPDGSIQYNKLSNWMSRQRDLRNVFRAMQLLLESVEAPGKLFSLLDSLAWIRSCQKFRCSANTCWIHPWRPGKRNSTSRKKKKSILVSTSIFLWNYIFSSMTASI